MDKIEKDYFSQQQHGAVVQKDYLQCPGRGAINKFTSADIILEEDGHKYYHIKCWECGKEFGV